MIWQVIYSAKAKQDLRDITEYLSYVLMMPETARKLASRIIKEIEGLDFMPSRFQVFPHEPWASKGIRCLPVKKYNIQNFLHDKNSAPCDAEYIVRYL